MVTLHFCFLLYVTAKYLYIKEKTPKVTRLHRLRHILQKIFFLFFSLYNITGVKKETRGPCSVTRGLSIIILFASFELPNFRRFQKKHDLSLAWFLFPYIRQSMHHHKSGIRSIAAV